MGTLGTQMYRLLPAVIVGLAGELQAGPAFAEPPAYLEKDRAELIELMSGRWDNDRQVFFAIDLGYAEDNLPDRHHWHMTADPAEDSGDLLGEHQRAGGTLHAVRHVFEVDGERRAIRHEMRTSDSEPGSDCTLYWQRIADGFRAHGEGTDCPRIAPGPGEGDYSLIHTLTANEYWVEAGPGEERSKIMMRRARDFTCWAAILRGAEHGDSGEGMRDWDFRRDVSLHDQGGEAELVTDEEPPRMVRLRLRDVEWVSGTRRPSLTLYVLEGESNRATSYAWTEGGANRVGINLRWLQASCTHEPGETP